MKQLKIFAAAVLAGACVALGGTVFLSLESKVLGALFFIVGLFTICTFGLNLFTGKVCYVFDNRADYALALPVIWVGNLAGTWLVAFLGGLTRMGPALTARAIELCRDKLSDGFLSLLILGALCNVLIYIAVEGFRSTPHSAGKYLSLFFGVMVFILCGFEHCIADMYYFSMAGVWSGDVLLRVLTITLGNALGGIAFRLVHSFFQGRSKSVVSGIAISHPEHGAQCDSRQGQACV